MIRYTTITEFRQLCSLKQPFVFFRKQTFTIPSLHENRQSITLKDSSDYYSNDDDNNTATHYTSGISIMCKTACSLMNMDERGLYFSENNDQFLDESGLLEEMKSLDNEIEPVHTMTRKYDLLLGSKNVCTPLRYHTNTCQFLYVHTGKVQIKLASWKYTKYVNQTKDFFAYDFRSPLHVWDFSEKKNTEKYLLDNIPFIEFEVTENSILYLPPHWWYSICYNTSDAILFHYTYSTMVNSLAFLTDISHHYIKQWEVTYVDEPISLMALEKKAERAMDNASISCMSSDKK
jgi:hypothetical protein